METTHTVVQQWPLPIELLTRIAQYVALPTKNNPAIDLSFLGIDRLSDLVFREVLIKQFAFVAVLVHPCIASHQAYQNNIVAEYEQVFGTPQVNKRLWNLYDSGAVWPSALRINVSCQRGFSGNTPSLALFTTVDTLKTILLLCHQLQRHDILSIEVDCEASNSGAAKILSTVLEHMARLVTSKDISVDKHANLPPILDKQIDKTAMAISLIIESSKDLIHLLENHFRALQSLLDNDNALAELFTVIATFTTAYRSTMRRIFSSSNNGATTRTQLNHIKLLLLNYVYIAYIHTSEHILTRTLTSHEQFAFLFDTAAFSTIKYYTNNIETITGRKFLEGRSETKSLEELHFYAPVLKARVQFHTAIAKMAAMSRGETEYLLCRGRSRAAATRDFVTPVLAEMRRIGRMYVDERSEVEAGAWKEGLHVVRRDETRGWLVEMRRVVGDVVGVSEDVAGMGGEMVGMGWFGKQPVMRKSCVVEKLPW
ncbi:hypothetical protein PMZ80_000817 [Knufia obscura]|uniref:Uncharacterized protein n=1 Tax=Knufia obscura TaxID=1635080 RepID=A0ABR0S2T6_9EURO|nr:hypothetical protein PMZ80_000817 [Knufia obscura]